MTNEQVLTNGMAKAKEIIEKKVIESLSNLGEASIEHGGFAKEYTNRTYNLIDSYGYAIYRNNERVKTWMNPVAAIKNDTKGGRGHARAEEFFSQHTSKSPWELVVVAGEFYAADVQILYYLDVLTGAYQFSEDRFFSFFKPMA